MDLFLKEEIEKYRTSGLEEERIDEVYERLLRIMEHEELYTNSELSLQILADRLSITRHSLSQIINQKTGRNYYYFINKYRIERVKHDLIDPAKKDISILEIAYDAGFNSKAAFNKIFKESTKMTPFKFRKKHLRTQP